jgi:hypothetical protein
MIYPDGFLAFGAAGLGNSMVLNPPMVAAQWPPVY